MAGSGREGARDSSRSLRNEQSYRRRWNPKGREREREKGGNRGTRIRAPPNRRIVTAAVQTTRLAIRFRVPRGMNLQKSLPASPLQHQHLYRHSLITCPVNPTILLTSRMARITIHIKREAIATHCAIRPTMPSTRTGDSFGTRAPTLSWTYRLAVYVRSSMVGMGKAEVFDRLDGRPGMLEGTLWQAFSVSKACTTCGSH